MIVTIALRFTRVMAVATHPYNMISLLLYNWPPYD
jgi:hypothetical protein